VRLHLAKPASTHHGRTVVKRKETATTCRENCYCFVPDRSTHALRVIKVKGIARVDGEELNQLQGFLLGEHVPSTGAEQNAGPPGGGAQEHEGGVADGVVVPCKRLAWGNLWVCEAVDCGAGSTVFVPEPRQQQLQGPNSPIHTLPVALRRLQQLVPIKYVVDLREIEASCLVGKSGDGAHRQSVFLPYLQVAKHSQAHSRRM
jgi:hypothetical protein